MTWMTFVLSSNIYQVSGYSLKVLSSFFVVWNISFLSTFASFINKQAQEFSCEEINIRFSASKWTCDQLQRAAVMCICVSLTRIHKTLQLCTLMQYSKGFIIFKTSFLVLFVPFSASLKYSKHPPKRTLISEFRLIMFLIIAQYIKRKLLLHGTPAKFHLIDNYIKTWTLSNCTKAKLHLYCNWMKTLPLSCGAPAKFHFI